MRTFGIALLVLGVLVMLVSLASGDPALTAVDTVGAVSGLMLAALGMLLLHPIRAVIR